jgi:hypothetical protein
MSLASLLQTNLEDTIGGCKMLCNWEKMYFLNFLGRLDVRSLLKRCQRGVEQKQKQVGGMNRQASAAFLCSDLLSGHSFKIDWIFCRQSGNCFIRFGGGGKGETKNQLQHFSNLADTTSAH